MEEQNNSIPVSNDSLMPHQEPHNGNSQVIQPSVISQAPVEVRDFITVSKSDFGVIAEPKSKKLPVVVLVLAGLIGLFVLYEYVVYRSLVG
jgi:hypothetical protein